MPRESENRPKSWFFPTENPDIFELCDWNARERAYKDNCREVRREDLSNYVGKSLVAAVNGAQKLSEA